MTEKIDDENTRLFYTKRGKEIDLDKVELWASRHLSIENMASLMGLERSILYLMFEENPQFQQNFYAAIESGKAKVLEMATNKLLELVEEGHPQSIQYYLERKGGWTKTETIKNEHTGKDGTALQTQTTVSKDDIKQAMKELQDEY